MQSVAIITVGDELLIGQVVDTNSAWIGSTLSEIGITVTNINSVADRAQAIEQALSHALANYSVVIMTGGLGPTKDDITKHTVARFFDVPLVRDMAVYDHVKTLLALRGVEFNELNQGQADMPQGFTALHNAVGTAPGLFRDTGSTLLFCLPGVPFEMKQLLLEQVVPRIRSKFTLPDVVHSTALVYGLPESELAIRIESWESALPDFLHLAYLPNPSGIRLRLSAYGVDRTKVAPMIEERFAALAQIIPDEFLGMEPTSLDTAVGRLLCERGAMVAVAESCTGGAIAARFTARAGSSAYFAGGVVAYSNDIKINVLKVDSELISRYGAVSEQVVRAMALGVQRLTGAAYAIATSGIAGPDGGSAEKPVGTVWVAVATGEGVRSVVRNFGSPRSVCIDRTVSFAIDMLRKAVIGDQAADVK